MLHVHVALAHVDAARTALVHGADRAAAASMFSRRGIRAEANREAARHIDAAAGSLDAGGHPRLSLASLQLRDGVAQLRGRRGSDDALRAVERELTTLTSLPTFEPGAVRAELHAMTYDPAAAIGSDGLHAIGARQRLLESPSTTHVDEPGLSDAAVRERLAQLHASVDPREHGAQEDELAALLARAVAGTASAGELHVAAARLAADGGAEPVVRGLRLMAETGQDLAEIDAAGAAALRATRETYDQASLVPASGRVREASRVVGMTERGVIDARGGAAVVEGEGQLSFGGVLHDDAMSAGRLLRERDEAELARVETVLRRGTPVGEYRTVGHVDETHNGELELRTLELADEPGRGVDAIRKPADAQAAHEEFGYQFFRKLGLSGHVPVIARGEVRAANIEFLPGVELDLVGIRSPRALRDALHETATGDGRLLLGDDDARRVARVEHGLLQVADYLVGNRDRHPGNALLHERGVAFFDFGHIGYGLPKDPLKPSMFPHYLGRIDKERRVELDPAVVDHLRRVLTPDDVRSLHATYLAKERVPDTWNHGAKARQREVAGRSFADGIVQRLEHVLATGGFSYT